MEYGLIGSKLGHSYSKIIHEMLCGYRYDLCPLPTEEEARAFLTRRAFRAINVTIPYKRLVMESCSYIDPRAKAIGAVNTVVNRNGLLYGYNTDYLGFAYLADAHGVEFAGRTVLILGTGGTHNTTSAVAKDKGAARVLSGGLFHPGHAVLLCRSRPQRGRHCHQHHPGGHVPERGGLQSGCGRDAGAGSRPRRGLQSG